MIFRSPVHARLTVMAILLMLFFADYAHVMTVDRILATVDDQVITFGDYRLFTREFSERASGDTVDERLLRQLIEEKLMAFEAQRRGLETSETEIEKAIEEFVSRNNLSQDGLESSLKEDGLDLEKFRGIVKEKILISQILSRDVDAKVLITDSEIDAYYREHKREFLEDPEYVELKAIFLLLREGSSLTEITDMKRRALKIAGWLKDGANFDNLAEEYSDEPLRSHKGMLGRFTRGTLIPPLDQKAFTMNPGDISDPIWVGDGVFILQLVSRTEETYKQPAEVKPLIYELLFKMKREQVLNDWIKGLWEKSSVRIHQS